MNIAIIGCGYIAHEHAKVLTSLGVKILAASDINIQRLHEFQVKFNVSFIYDSWREMIENKNIDALWVTVSWNFIDKILLDVLKIRKPVFFEKPIALSSEKIKMAIEQFPEMLDKVQIGYNRRFYDFVPRIKQYIKKFEINSIEVHIPESTQGVYDKNLLRFLFLQNSSHIIDLLYYLLDKPKILVDKIYRKETIDKVPLGYNGLLTANSIPIHLIANWDSPSNFGIKFHTKHSLIELLPVEKASIYEGFNIIEPTEINPIRQYIPKLEKQYFISRETAKYKPGFLLQIKNFIETCILKQKENLIGADLKSTLEVTKICEEIMGRHRFSQVQE